MRCRSILTCCMCLPRFRYVLLSLIVRHPFRHGSCSSCFVTQILPREVRLKLTIQLLALLGCHLSTYLPLNDKSGILRSIETTLSYLEFLEVLSSSLQCLIHLIHFSSVTLSDGAFDTRFASHVSKNNVRPFFGFDIRFVHILYHVSHASHL